MKEIAGKSYLFHQIAPTPIKSVDENVFGIKINPFNHKQFYVRQIEIHV